MKKTTMMLLPLLALAGALPWVNPASDGALADSGRDMTLCDGETTIHVAQASLAGALMPRETAASVANTLLNAYQDKQQDVRYTRRDSLIWKREYERNVAEGYKWFHSNTLSTNGISCDMCHPDGSDTHPETYPKFQVQLKKVVLLRDMINWCIENPLEGKPLAEDDERLRAMEMYIHSARAGATMLPGKR